MPQLWRKDGRWRTMTDFYFAVRSDPCDVFIVIGDNWVHYKRCETEEIARILVDGQNESRGGKP